MCLAKLRALCPKGIRPESLPFPSAASQNVTDFCHGLDRHLLHATYSFTPNMCRRRRAASLAQRKPRRELPKQITVEVVVVLATS